MQQPSRFARRMDGHATLGARRDGQNKQEPWVYGGSHQRLTAKAAKGLKHIIRVDLQRAEALPPPGRGIGVGGLQGRAGLGRPRQLQERLVAV